MSERIEKIHALVDGELSTDERASMLEEIHADPQANLEFQWAEAMKSTVQRKCQSTATSADWERAKARLKQLERAKTTNFLVSKYAWSLCGVLFVGILTAGLLNQRNRNLTLSATSAAEIIRAPWVPAETNSIGKQYAELRPFNDSLVINAREGVAITGLQRASIEGRKVASVSLADSEGAASLFAIMGLEKFEGVEQKIGYTDYRMGLVNGHPCVTWKQGDYLMMITGDRNWEALVALSKKVR